MEIDDLKIYDRNFLDFMSDDINNYNYIIYPTQLLTKLELDKLIFKLLIIFKLYRKG